jgi:hypothetical protein
MSLTPDERWQAFRVALGARGVTFTRSAAVDEQLAAAGRRGWTMPALGRMILADWPPDVDSPRALVWRRLVAYTETGPPDAEPVRVRTPSPVPSGPRTPMPEDVRAMLTRQSWWKPRPRP